MQKTRRHRVRLEGEFVLICAVKASWRTRASCCASEAEAAVKLLSAMQYANYVLTTAAGVNQRRLASAQPPQHTHTYTQIACRQKHVQYPVRLLHICFPPRRCRLSTALAPAFLRGVCAITAGQQKKNTHTKRVGHF